MNSKVTGEGDADDAAVPKQGPLDLWLIRETTKIKVWIFLLEYSKKNYLRK